VSEESAEESAEPRVIGAEKRDQERVPFFVIDDVTYYVPKVVPRNISIKALEIFRDEGEMAIASWLCQEVLGEEAYAALRDCEDLTDEDLRFVFDELTTRALGPLEKALGKRKSGR
jgi:hypothetical protein